MSYWSDKISQIPGGGAVMDFKHKYLDKYNIIGDPGDLANMGGSGGETAAAAAGKAKEEANALAALQWQRQMAGLQQSTGYVNNMQDLYNSIYTPGGGALAAGGGRVAGPSPTEMSALTAVPRVAEPPAAKKPGMFDGIF